MANCNELITNRENIVKIIHILRAVARTLIGGGGVYIHIFRFCPTSFFWNKVDFKRSQSGRTRIYEYTPPPN